MKRHIFLTLFFILLIIQNPEAREANKNVKFLRLKNGFNLVLIENHSSPLIASVVTVNVGSVNESREINGISHMLEHLLFNGTTNRTQEQLDHEQNNYGIYNNAHTDRDYTNYIALVEKDFIEKALDIQSDMLFNSIFPKDKFEKEKGIILNELARDSSDDFFWAQEFFNRNFYEGTPYNLTVLGIPSSIKEINREQVINYYQTYYKPNNMTALVMGDFDPDVMIRLFGKYYGSIPPGKIPKPKIYQINSSNFGKTHLQKIGSNNVYLHMGSIAPSIGDNNFYPFALLTKALNMRLKDELNKRLIEKNGSQIFNISAHFDFSKSMSSFTISSILSPNSEVETVKEEILRYLKDFSRHNIEEKKIRKIINSLIINEQFLAEKPHYYGMMKGPLLAAGDWEFTSNYIDLLADVSMKELTQVGQTYFADPNFFASATLPGNKKPIFTKKNLYSSQAKKMEYKEESLLLTKLWNREYSLPQEKGQIKTETSILKNQNLKSAKLDRKINKIVFKNGLTLLINSNPDSGVFAIHLLAQNRTAMEPKNNEGIADLIHRLMERRTKGRDKQQLKDALKSIGAILKTRDNPFIPYDNYYTSRQFSFIRLQTIDKFYKEAIYNFSDIVFNPSFLKEDIEEVRKEMISLIGKENKNPSIVSRQLLYEELFNNSPVIRRINGTEKSINSIGQTDLEAFYKIYFAPNNLIISLSTSIDYNLVLNELNKYVEELPLSKSTPKSSGPLPVFSKGKSLKLSFKKTQSYIRLGTLFKMNKDEENGLRVLASILSQKLAQNLRETKGLAYSLGASFSMHGEHGLFQVAVGTRANTLNEVEKDIFKEIEEIKKQKLSPNKINGLINLYNSRRLMRSLTRISQSYQMGINEFNGRPFNYDEFFLQDIKKLTYDKIQKLAIKYLKPENMVQIIIQ